MFLAYLDYQNLDNPLFLKSFAETLRQIGPQKAIILHADSEYTDRIVQTGVMRDQARIRSVKDLNHRLVSFLADYGIACTGVNGYQRGTIKKQADAGFQINRTFLNTVPDGVITVLSNLVEGPDGQPEFCEATEVADALMQALEIQKLLVFSTDSAENLFTKPTSSPKKSLSIEELSKHPEVSLLPDELRASKLPITLCKPLYNNILKGFHEILDLNH